MPTSDPRPIRRCVCANVTFEEMRRQGVASLADAERLGYGIGCGLCRAFIQAMIDTGETAFRAD